MRTTTRLRQLHREKDLLVAPGCFDPMSARIVQWLGFDAVYMGGNNTGWHLAVGEPLVTMTEQVEEARKAAKVVDIPLIADAGPDVIMPLLRDVRELEVYRREVPDIPLVHLLLPGQALSQVRDLGWNIVLVNATATIAAARAIIDVYQGLKEKGYVDTPWDLDIRRLVQTEVLRMPEAWEMEARTVEKA